MVAMLSFTIFSALFISSLCEVRQSLLVHTSQGPMRGYKDMKDDVYVFYNIPYATAPTGINRFKAPLPAPTWNETFEAVDEEIICPQKDLLGVITESKRIKENCLIANIYTPDTNAKNIPVVVYIHGGAYLIGWGEMLTPKKIVSTKRIIAVTFNYRLAAHGFLCLGTKDVPGNAGMKDQVALLRWVKKNIASFGGNPDDVTIAGYSAGSSSVDLLSISKMAEGLFKRVILESGSNTASWSVQINPIKNAKMYAKLLNFEKVDNFNALEEFYKTIPYEQLNSNVFNRTESSFFMSPCVELDVGEERFLSESPVDTLKNGNFKKLPMLYGFSNMEGLIRAPLFDEWKELMNNKFSDFLPVDLQFKNENEKEIVADKIKRFYFGDGLIQEKDILAYVDYFTDVIFAYPTLRSLQYQVEAGNDQTYLYEYSYVDEDTPYVPYTKTRGANHCMQTGAVLDNYINGTTLVYEESISDNKKQIKSVMREIWLSFMTTGKPIPESSSLPPWPPAGVNRSPYMKLDSSLELREHLLKERTLFWDGIYDKYYLKPSAPTPPPEHIEL